MTKAFTRISSQVIGIPRDNIDTDQIIPARYLKVTDKEGLAEGLFSSWRSRADGSPDPDFPLNQPALSKAQFLAAGDNFGCGSSREHAPWALTGWGLRAVISTSFADIFRNNAIKNGLLPVAVDAATLRQIFSLAADDPSAMLTIDLAEQSLYLPDGCSITFEIDDFSKTCLLEGIDQLGYLLKHEAEISAYEHARVNI
jgi:3-isopropylmalate/(R)-2-methylmalate dehydratase small subunit